MTQWSADYPGKIGTYFVVLLVATMAASGVNAANEDEVRTAFLFQLAQYVHWPADAARPQSSPLKFCVAGKDRLTSTLENTVRGKSIQGRAILIRRMEADSDPAGCDLVFLTYQSEKQIKGWLKEWSYPPVLLVGETERFAEIGGMVNLSIEGGRVSFEINVLASSRANIEFRSQLLRFARIVKTPGEKGTKP